MRGAGKHRDILAAEVDAVGRMNAAVEEAELFERHCRGRAVAALGLLVVLGAAGHVQMQADAVFVGDRHLLDQQRLGVVDIGRVRAEPGNDAAIGRTLLLEESRGPGQFLRATAFVAQLHDAIGDDGAESGILHGVGDLLGEEILVAESGGARERHLGAAQRHGGADIGGNER